MKRLAILSVLVLVTTTFAFSANLIGFGAQVEYANLSVPDPLKPAYGAGYGGGVHLDFRFGIVTLRVNGDYITFGADQNAYRDLIYNSAVAENPAIDKNAISLDGGRVGVLAFGANGKFNLPHMAVSPYAIVGVGTATLSVSDLNVSYQGTPVGVQTGLASQTKFMANAGAGVDFTLATVALFAEFKYTWIFTDNQTITYFPVTVGVTF